MNHDYTQCIDFTDDCPKDCFRAQLMRDFELNWKKYINIPISYAHFKHEEGICEFLKENKSGK